jgi:hypothetical protein
MAAAIHNSGGKVQQSKLDTYLALPCLALLTDRKKEKKRNLGFHVSIPSPTPSKGATPTATTPQTCSKIQKSVGNI